MGKKQRQSIDATHSCITRILLKILKNLVYIFAIVIVLSFFIMMYITYTESGVNEFLGYSVDKHKDVEIESIFKFMWT